MWRNNPSDCICFVLIQEIISIYICLILKFSSLFQPMFLLNVHMFVCCGNVLIVFHLHKRHKVAERYASSEDGSGVVFAATLDNILQV